MVRYDRDHKERTRESILQAAAEAFRLQGIDGVGVADIMAGAGLTHGGFYAHFAGKDELAGEAGAYALTQAAHRRFAPSGEEEPEDLAGYIRSYLSRSHRDSPASGCAVPALANDIARRSPETRHAFTEAARTYVEGIASLLPAGEDEDLAWALLGGMAGAVMLARAVDDPALSDRILLAARRLYARAFPAGAQTPEEEA